jgi:hypothetical protein
VILQLATEEEGIVPNSVLNTTIASKHLFGAVTVLLTVFMAGVGVNAAFGRVSTHEPRLVQLEEYRMRHEREVADDILRRLTSSSIAQDSIQRRLGRMERLMSCDFYNINPCPGAIIPTPPER